MAVFGREVTQAKGLDNGRVEGRGGGEVLDLQKGKHWYNIIRPGAGEQCGRVAQVAGFGARGGRGDSRASARERPGKLSGQCGVTRRAGRGVSGELRSKQATRHRAEPHKLNGPWRAGARKRAGFGERKGKEHFPRAVAASFRSSRTA